MIRINRFTVVLFLYSFVLAFFAFYTYSQVDLNLTLSSNAWYQSIQGTLTHLGYFNRPLSSSLYLIFVVLLGAFYLYFAAYFRREGSFKQLLAVVGVTGFILLFSYPAFSYDIFNYLFDARVQVLYGQDPTLVRPLDFPGDPWIRFMRWTHRESVYPFGWTLFSTVPYFLGMGKFTLTLLLFKAVAVFSYFTSVFFVYKIVGRLSHLPPVFSTTLFALHPLVLIEALVSGHNDIVMMAVFLFATYLFVRSFDVPAFLVGLVSVSIKYITVLGSFLFLLRGALRRFGISKSAVWYLSLLCGLQAVFVLFWSVRFEFQIWYVLWFLPLVVLLPYRFVVSTVSLFSYLLLFLYFSYLLHGEWDAGIYSLKLMTIAGALLVGVVVSWVRPWRRVW